jgi:hypothetical protein
MFQLDDHDCEIIALCIQEGLSNRNAAEAISMSEEAASKRFARAWSRPGCSAQNYSDKLSSADERLKGVPLRFWHRLQR